MKAHRMDVYIQDLLTRVDMEKPASVDVFLMENFDSIVNGTNVLFRDFSYVKSTPRNRIAFAKYLGALLNANDDDEYKAADYFHIIELICTDFPCQIVRKIARLTEYSLGLKSDIEVSDSSGPMPNLLPKHGFLHIFGLYFFYMEFLELCESYIMNAFANALAVPLNELAFNFEELKAIRGDFASQLQLSMAADDTL
ncbi:hypothetical protein HDU84_008371 [Entophlyctis sp. JEL0112]|nr:hypothetical protein HDU84_008371 [Entophlyctis sp. JEL0112]